jgi:hypothetical protein
MGGEVINGEWVGAESGRQIDDEGSKSVSEGGRGASSGDNLVLHEVKADKPRCALRLEVAAHSVLHHGLQFVGVVGLSVD